MFAAIGRFCVRRRWLVLLGWVLLVAAGAVASGPVFAGLQSARASDRLEAIQAYDVIDDNAAYGGRVLGLVDDVRIADPAVRTEIQAAVRDVARISDVAGSSTRTRGSGPGWSPPTGGPRWSWSTWPGTCPGSGGTPPSMRPRCGCGS